MKTRQLLLALLGVALTFSCMKEAYEAPTRPGTGKKDDPEPEKENVISYEAVIEEDAFRWQEKDSMGVWTSKERWARFDLNSSAGLRKGMFVGRLEQGETAGKYAVYPYREGISLSENRLTASLPVEPDGSCPLVAKLNADEALSFRFLTGALNLSLQTIPEEAQTLVVEADMPIAGTFSVDLERMDFAFSGEGVRKVSFALKDGRTDYRLPVPEGPCSIQAWFEKDGLEIAGTRMDIGREDYTRGKVLLYEQGKIVGIEDLYMTPDGAGSHNGKNWENAFAADDLAEIFAGQVSEDNISRYAGAVVHLAGGTYKPSKSLNFDFTKAGEPVEMSFVGGYDPATGLRDSDAHPSVIDGASSESGHYARFDKYAHLTFDDIVFRDFSKGKVLFYLNTGATNKDIDVCFRHCSFSGNKTDANITSNGNYGGVFFVLSGLLRVQSCTFENNEAVRGGTITVLGQGRLRVSGTESLPTVFRGNNADTGGALYVENTLGEVSLSHARFENNTATRAQSTWAAGGAASLMRNTATGTMAVSFTDCAFVGNKAPDACGGAIGLYNPEQKSLNLTRCRFEGNECLSRGGALFTDSGANGKDVYRFSDCSFVGNKATGTASGTGWGGAVDVQTNFKGTMYVDHCTFTGNTAVNGGGAWVDYNNGMVCSLFFNACRFNGNYAEDGKNGNAVNHCSGYAAFHNCAFWDNYSSGQATPRDILTGSSSSGCLVLSQTTMHQPGGNAPVYISAGVIRINVVNSILATSGYPTSIATGQEFLEGTSGSYVLEIGKSNTFYTTFCTNKILLGYDTWKNKFEQGYKFTGNLTEAGFTTMTQSSSAYIRALGDERDLAFDTWLSGLGAYNRDIDGTLRSGNWTPGCVQTTQGENPTARRVSILGDSISTYDGFLSGSTLRPFFPRGNVDDVTKTWWHQLIYQKMENAILDGNYAYSGSQVARATNNAYQNTTWWGQGFVERYLRDGCGNPDVIFIFGGTNDYMHKETGICPGAPGVIYNNTGYLAPETVLQQVLATADAPATRDEIVALPDSDFSSAYAKLLRLVRCDHPSAKVVCIVGDILYEPVQKSILAIAGHYACPVVDFYAAHGYNDTENVPKIDGVHPNETGMIYICDKIYNETKSYIE